MKKNNPQLKHENALKSMTDDNDINWFVWLVKQNIFVILS